MPGLGRIKVTKVDLEDIAIVFTALMLASSSVMLIPRPARASMMVMVDVSEITPTLFDPQAVNISVGDSVIWFGIHDAHTTTAYPGQAMYWDSGSLTEGLSFMVVFTQPGNFTYRSLYPEDAGQIAWVYVAQPTPEFPGYMVLAAVAAAALLALLLERRMRS